MSLLLVTMATAFTEPSVQTMFATKKCVCTFIAEHNLSFTVAQTLKNLCERLSEDKSALTKLSVSMALPQGLDPFSAKLKKVNFLVKIEKATNVNMDRNHENISF